MNGLLALLAVFTGLALFAWAHVWHQRMRHHGAGSALTGFLIIGFRWLCGGTWHGGALSDRGWFRDASDKTLTQTGHAHRAYHTRQWKVAARRLGTFAVLLCTGYGWLSDRPATILALLAAMPAMVTWAAWRGWRRWRHRRHRKSWLAPLHATIHHHVRRPVTDRPESYIRVALDRSSGHVELPIGVSPSERFRKQLETDIRGRLGIPSAEFDWAGIAGPKPVVRWAPAPHPPDMVTLEMARDAIETARRGELVAGLGTRGQAVKIRLAGEVPHFLVNGPTGSGKSAAVQSAIAQFLFHGGFAIILDFKQLSQVTFDSLDGTAPNIAYCRSDEEIYGMLMWLQGELRRRNKVARFAARRDGTIEANVGDSLMLAAEELNVTATRLRQWWAQAREPKDPPRCPAVDAMNELLFMGRQARIHVLQASQRGDANAVGGGAARENLTARLLLGKIQKPTWKMLAGEFEYPATMSGRQGHGHLVSADVTEVQAVYMTPQEAWDLALAGEVAAPPHGIPYLGAATGRAALISADEGTGAPVAAPPRPLLGLRAAQRAGMLGTRSLIAVRTHRNRYRDRWPVPAAYDGQEELYDDGQLAVIRGLMGERRK